jgi:hypothetical protein
MINISAAMGGQFAFAAAEMTAEIKQLGPNPLRREITNDPPARIDSGLKEEAEATFNDAPDLTLRDPV